MGQIKCLVKLIHLFLGCGFPAVRTCEMVNLFTVFRQHTTSWSLGDWGMSPQSPASTGHLSSLSITTTHWDINIRDITLGTWFPYKPHIEEISIANEECWEVAEFSISKQYHVSWTASANQNLDPTIPAEYRGLLYRQMILDSSCILQRVSLMIIFWRWPLAPAQHPALLYKAFNQRSIH